MLLLAASPFCGDSHSALSSIVTELMASDNLSSSCLSGLYSLCMLMFCHFSLFSAVILLFPAECYFRGIILVMLSSIGTPA